MNDAPKPQYGYVEKDLERALVGFVPPEHRSAPLAELVDLWKRVVELEAENEDLRQQLDAANREKDALVKCHSNCVEALAQVAAVCRATDNDVPGDAVAAARIMRRQQDATANELARTQNALKTIGDECHAWRKLMNDTERALGMETVAMDPSARSVVEWADDTRRQLNRLSSLVTRWKNGDLPTDVEWAAAILAAKGASDGQA